MSMSLLTATILVGVGTLKEVSYTVQSSAEKSDQALQVGPIRNGHACEISMWRCKTLLTAVFEQEFMKVGKWLLNAQFVAMFVGIMFFFMQLGQVQRVP